MVKKKTTQKRRQKSPSEKAGGDLFDTIFGTAADAFVEHALPWMGRKAVEMGRYGASELMRNKKLQKKAVNYGINKLTPFILDSVGTAMDQLSTKVRPKKKYKTTRKDLDGKGINPMNVAVKKAPDISMKTTQELIPSLKPVYDRYKSGDIMKSAFGSEQGITSSKFWRRPTAAEEKARGIIRKGSNPDLFFAFKKDGKRFRQYKTTFFNKNPEALTDMHNIISSNPDIWPDIIRNKYDINIDEHFWENNPLTEVGYSQMDWKTPKTKSRMDSRKVQIYGPIQSFRQTIKL